MRARTHSCDKHHLQDVQTLKGVKADVPPQQVQRRVAVIVARVGVGAQLEQLAQGAHIRIRRALERGGVQRRPALRIAHGRDGQASGGEDLQQRRALLGLMGAPQSFVIPDGREEVCRALAALRARVHVRARLDQRAHDTRAHTLRLALVKQRRELAAVWPVKGHARGDQQPHNVAAAVAVAVMVVVGGVQQRGAGRRVDNVRVEACAAREAWRQGFEG